MGCHHHIKELGHDSIIIPYFGAKIIGVHVSIILRVTTRLQIIIFFYCKESVDGEVVYVGGEDGVFYDKLEIELPRNSKVCREKDTLVIKNRAFDIRFESKFSGFCSVLPCYFEKFYMNRSMEDTHNYRIDLRLSIKLKPLFLIYNNGWKYLGWIDQIGNKFVEYFSYNEFVKKIGYEQAVTNYILFYNRLHPYKETGEDKRIKDVRIIKIESEEKND